MTKKLGVAFSLLFAILPSISCTRVALTSIPDMTQDGNLPALLQKTVRDFHLPIWQELTLNSQSRKLQRTVDEVCEQYNLQLSNGNVTKQTMTCVCANLEESEIYVDCVYDEPSCNTDVENNVTACIEGGFGLTLNSDGDHYKTKSCFNVTTSEVPQNTCVEVVASAPKDFSIVQSCAATLNGEECNYCEICDGANKLTVDCCNVVDDKKQSKCSEATENGGFTPIYDVVDTPGQCTGINTYAGSSFGVSYWPIISLLLGGLQAFLGVINL